MLCVEAISSNFSISALKRRGYFRDNAEIMQNITNPYTLDRII